MGWDGVKVAKNCVLFERLVFMFKTILNDILGSVIVASDFDAQMSGINFWKGDDNQRPVNKNRLAKFQWLLEFWTF
jgi:hypothetical protein